MRFAHIQNLRWRAGFNELGEYLMAIMLRVLDLAVQFAIGEGASAAFTKLHIGFGIELVLAPQCEGVLGTLAHFLTTLQNDGFKAHLCQH